jgi:hypothetical protein
MSTQTKIFQNIYFMYFKQDRKSSAPSVTVLSHNALSQHRKVIASKRYRSSYLEAVIATKGYRSEDMTFAITCNAVTF